MDKPRIVLKFNSLEELNAEFESHLKSGGAFVRRDLNLKMGDECEVAIVHPKTGEEKTLPSKVVMAVDQGDSTGIGIAFNDFNPQKREELRAFIGFIKENKKETIDETAIIDEATTIKDDRRYLTETERFNIAREGDMAQRIQLEKRYGKLVWEMLLRNPRLTKMEVARIARKAEVNKQVRDLILANNAWVSDSQVRQAILTNLKFDEKDIMKVLRHAPKHELKALSHQGATSPRIRKVALKLLLG